MSVWQLEVLGKARLSCGARAMTLERKTAALLSYLSLEGATTRSKLAGLLWPDSGESTARNNLAQVLRRLRKGTGAVLVSGEDVLSLGEALTTDAARLKELAFSGNLDGVLERSGDLLAHYDYDDLADFSDWLHGERERLTALQRGALLGALERLEREGAYRDASTYARELLALEPVSEEAHRHLIRLSFLAGDRPAALKAYGRCKEVLRRELGVEPLPETVALAREVARGEVPRPAVPAKSPLPLSVLRPPLVGREGAWAQLEAAWEAGQAIFISGPPGAGKSRLMHEFVSIKGSYGHFQGRPGDRAVPYAFHVRSWRHLLATFPDLPLEPWARQELSRLLPELSAVPPPPLTSEADKLRLFEAKGQLVERATWRGWTALVVDDLQYIDAASFEAGSYLIGRFLSARTPEGPRTVNSFRTGELTPETEAQIGRLVDAGLAAHIELSPLSPNHTTELLAGLELSELRNADLGHLAEKLYRATGGNPLFIVETLKSLIESGTLHKAPHSPLPLSHRVGTLLKERLAHLSPVAQKLCWAAAVAQDEFDLELAGATLEMDLFDLGSAYQEVAKAQIFVGGWFSHDLLYEAALSALQAPVKALLHRRCALYLSGRASHARVAEHWLMGGEPARALPHLFEAGRDAAAKGLYEEASRAFQGVVQEAEPKSTLRLEATLNLGLALIHLDTAEGRCVLEETLETVRGDHRPLFELRTLAALARLEVAAGDQPQAQAHLGRAFRRAPDDLPVETRAELLDARLEVALRSADLKGAEATTHALLELFPDALRYRHGLALLYWHQGRLREGLTLLGALAEQELEPVQKNPVQREVFNDLGMTYWALGYPDTASLWLRQSLEGGSPYQCAQSRSNLGLSYISAGRYAEALEHLLFARDHFQTLSFSSLSADTLHRLGVLHYRCDQPAAASPCFAAALALMRRVGDPFRVAYIAASLAASEAALGKLEAAQETAAEALVLAGGLGHPWARMISHQGASQVAYLSGQLESAYTHARHAAALARGCDATEQLAYALFYEAQASAAFKAASEGFRLAKERGLPDLRYRLARLLCRADPAYRREADEAATLLSARMPVGWELVSEPSEA